MIEESALQGIAERLRSGEVVMMSDVTYDALIEHELLDTDMASAHNPDRLGLLDALLVGRKAPLERALSRH